MIVSVIIPAYNRASVIEKSIKSVLNQTFSDLELIIVDDGSTDNTEDIINKISDTRIRYIRQKNNGACAARNNGIEHAKGELIAFHDSDDIWHCDKLEKQIAVLRRTNADVVFCKMNKIINGVNYGFASNFFKEGFLERDTLPLCIGTQTLIGKNSVFKQEKFDVDMPRFQEFELLIRIQKKFSIYSINDSLVDYILQKDSISKNPKTYLHAWNLILLKHSNFFNVYRSSCNRIVYDILENGFAVNNWNERVKFILLAFKFSKSPRTIARIVRRLFV